MIRNPANSTSAEKTRLREKVRTLSNRAATMTASARTTDAESNHDQRSRSDQMRNSSLSFASNQRPVIPCWMPLRQARMNTTGRSMTAACIAALIPERTQPVPRSCWRTASAEKQSRPSVPHPKVWAKKMMKLIGTKSAARSRVRFKRPSRSHRPKASSARAIDSAKLTKP